jgi:hypothetical protein
MKVIHVYVFERLSIKYLAKNGELFIGFFILQNKSNLTHLQITSDST